MLHSIKNLLGNKLGASDGEIGHVKDLYFDDQSWAVRYLVAETGSWLPARQVLISPRAFGRLYEPGKLLFVNLTRKQIEGSPSTDSHKPISRQYEEEYHRYYGWPYYWEGAGLWGMSNFPILEMPPEPLQTEAKSDEQPDRVDAHLRSAQAVNGYHVQTGEGNIGHICDFLMNDKSWAIEQMVVKTGHRISGKDVLIPTNSVYRISYDESKVFANLTGETAGQRSAHSLAPSATAH